MRRWLVIFLLVFLPLQTTWAAAGSYCQHETDVAAQHMGHHAHQHEAKDGDKAEAKLLKSALMVDADCDSCHTCCGAILLEVPSIAQHMAALATVSVYLSRTSSAISSPPDRPNWLLFV